jgi:DNA-binding NarL/FixJ family response regulator
MLAIRIYTYLQNIFIKILWKSPISASYIKVKSKHHPMTQKSDPPIQLLIADNHRIIRAGIRAALTLSFDKLPISIDEAETTEEAINKSIANCYDVILMDCHLRGLGGPKATKQILEKRPEARVLAFSIIGERSYIRQMMIAGARGYLLKNTGPDTLVIAIRRVLGGAHFYSKEITLKFFERDGSSTKRNSLTASERAAFNLILQEMTYEELQELEATWVLQNEGWKKICKN